jgi:hypothetical protein
MKWDTDVNTYILIFKDGCPEDFRPEKCPHCGYRGLLHRHGHYERAVITLSNKYSIVLYRFKCPCASCLKTHSLKPSFIGDKRQATWDVEETVFNNNEQGASFAKLAEDFPPPVGPYSEKTFWRWQNGWGKRLEAIHPAIFKHVIARIPQLSMPVGKNKPTNTKEWLTYLWDKWKDFFPEDEYLGLFQWLYRICKMNKVREFAVFANQ